MSENPEEKINIPQMPWFKALTLIEPYIFKISTPISSGTGFQISYYQNTKLCAIATAYHVIWHAEKWGEPIEITHYSSKKVTMLRAGRGNRAIIIHPKQDLAFIVYATKENLLQLNLKLIDPQKYLRPGHELGWCGFPAVESSKLCFFLDT